MDFTEQMNEKVENLMGRIEEVKDSKEYKKMLQFHSKFHNYSFGNQLLIFSQMPDATMVAGYNDWKEKFNRYVMPKKERKKEDVRENYIAIRYPIIKKVEKEKKDGSVKKEKELVGFGWTHVWDVSQTKPINEEGKIPSMDIHLKEENKELFNLIKSFAETKDIEIEERNYSDHRFGGAKEGNIYLNKNHNETEKANTLVHEIAHILLEHTGKRKENVTKEIAEMEAESVAYIVMDHFGIDSKSDKYLSLYYKSYDLKKSLRNITKVADQIIEFMVEKMENEKINIKTG
ncbi:MAG: ImmA/IrrE family metallo-endopeptidase [Bacillota bacterium]